MQMTVESIIEIVKKIVDISIVWAVFYYILKNIRNNVKLTLLFKGVAIVIIIKIRIHPNPKTICLINFICFYLIRTPRVKEYLYWDVHITCGDVYFLYIKLSQEISRSHLYLLWITAGISRSFRKHRSLYLYHAT